MYFLHVLHNVQYIAGNTYSTVRYSTVPEIVYLNRIIKICFDIIEGEVKIISEKANVWFSRFPNFKVQNCIEFLQ